MQAFVDKLTTELEDQIRFIEQENDIILKRSELSFEICKKVMDQLKSFILKYKFKSTAEEIKFFRDMKPLFYSKLIYHLSIYNIETKRPNGGDKILKKYLINELDKLKRYFDHNLDFYKYYRTSSNYLDHKYFVRGKQDLQLSIDSYFFETDTRFSTSHDYKISKILVHDQLQVYLEDELLYIERKEPRHKTQDIPKTKLSWLESKTAMIELIYAMQTQGAFGSQADIKEIAAYFEYAFNIDLGDYYRTYLELRIRKTGRTKFLLSLQESLTKRMDAQDEK
ncbi:MAG TPA: RteC domain-containing protein [Bacteroidia bacterium]|nr:RteC domain-containing protein [Bacteroidia bacterium]